MVTVFANFKIDDEDRFDNLKLSFNSFKNVKLFTQWIINVKGKYKSEVRKFLEKKLKMLVSKNMKAPKAGYTIQENY